MNFILKYKDLRFIIIALTFLNYKPSNRDIENKVLSK